ncbi:MAG: zf-HC2 domain-containing protein [Acidobacteriota bacterium]
MRCPNDFLMSQYADGELQDIENAEIAVHLAECHVCEKKALALTEENQLLRNSLQDVEIYEPDPVRAESMNIVRIFCAVSALLGIALLVRTSFRYISDTTLPAGLDWILPLSLLGKLNLIATGFFYFLEKGRDIMTSFINETSTVLVGLLVLTALIAMVRRSRKMASMVCLTTMLFFFVVPGHAVEIRKADKDSGNIYVAADETIDDSLVAFGDSVDIRGTVTGDLITFARRINVRGAVQGNIITFGQNVDIAGNVDGDVFGFAMTLRTNGDVGKNLWAFAQTMAIDAEGSLGQNATVFGANINADGSIGRDLSAFGAFVDVSGNVGRDLNVSGEKLTVQRTSVIGRNLNAKIKLEKNIQIDPEATILGTTNVSQPEEKIRPNKYLTFGFYFGQFLRIAGSFLMGMLLFWLLPGMKKAPLRDMRGLLISGGIGFIAAVATPIAALILVITLIGIPLAVTSLLFWLLALYFAKIVVGRYLGGMLLKNGRDTMGHTASTLLIGLVLIVIVVNLPYIGGIINVLLTILGLGALLVTGYRMFRGTPPAEPVLENTAV